MSEIGSGNGSSYPNAIDTNNIPEVNDPSPSRTKARAEVPNDLAACVVNVQTELGIDPAGTKADVKTYLQTEHEVDGTHADITPTSIVLQAGQVTWAKGVDVASATALTLGVDGNYFDITGTTTVTSIGTLGIGTIVKLHFDGIVTLTHSAADLVLPDGISITTVAGDEFEFIEYATGDWRMTSSSRSQTERAGNTVQVVNIQDGAYATGTTVIPFDDSIPQQSTDGDLYLSLSVTPTSSTNKLVIEGVMVFSADSTRTTTLVLYQDSIEGALSATIDQVGAGDTFRTIPFRHTMVAGTTSATTFKFYAGVDVAGNLYFNGIGAGRRMGGIMGSSMTITEIKV